MVVEANAPWLSPHARHWGEIIQSGHQRAFGRALIAGQQRGNIGEATAAQELFACTSPVLAHDGSSDPRLVYCNAAALQLWCRPWAEMVGMPSRLTAPPQERKERADALKTAQQADAYQGYRGIRIDRQGRRFAIHNARIWTLWDEQGCRCGQAASFSNWWWIDAKQSR